MNKKYWYQDLSNFEFAKKKKEKRKKANKTKQNEIKQSKKKQNTFLLVEIKQNRRQKT